MKHDELATDLADHLRGSGDVMTFENVQMGPSGSPRPDVLAIAKTFSKLDVRAYEVKVSKSDFRADVTKGKWRSYLEFSSSVTFAVEAGLVDKSEIPPQCGLIIRHPSGTWRHVKKPMPSQLDGFPWKVTVKLLMDGIDRANDLNRDHRWSEWKAEQKLSKKFGNEAARLICNIQQLPQFHADRMSWIEEDLNKARARVKEAQDEARREAARVRAEVDPDLQELALLLGRDGPTNMRIDVRELVRLLRGSSLVKRAVEEIDHYLKTLERTRARLTRFDFVGPPAPHDHPLTRVDLDDELF